MFLHNFQVPRSSFKTFWRSYKVISARPTALAPTLALILSHMVSDEDLLE